MFVVMYKIIAYLYDCMKKGVEPCDSAWGPEALGIPYSYWRLIVIELVSHGYVAGIKVSSVPGCEQSITILHPSVTMEGVQFAQENSMMGKAKQFLTEAKSAIPFV